MDRGTAINPLTRIFTDPPELLRALRTEKCQATGVSRLLDSEEIARQIAGLGGWQTDGKSLSRSYEFPDFPGAIRAIDQIAVEAEAMNHHPDIDIRWRTVDFTLSTHSEGGVTQLDIELAHRILDIANQLSAT